MNWATIRLELGSSEAFPRGSAGRAFLLNVPIDCDGCIDRSALEQNPGRATVRRFWASEADTFGIVEPADDRWALQCETGAVGGSTFLLEAVPLKQNESVQVLAPDGTEMAFRVATIRPTLSRIPVR